MKDLEKYELTAFKERLAFKNWTNNYNLFSNKEDWNVDIRPYFGNDVYDVLITRHKGGTIIKRFIIELKIRSKSYPTYLYETKKHASLKKIKDLDKEHNTILFINFTPSGTYVWNIDNILHKYKKVFDTYNKSTVKSTEDKEGKWGYMLETYDAKYYNYTWDEGQYIKETKQEKDIISIKRELNIFDYLVGKMGLG